MNFDAIVENVAFGKATQKFTSTLGMYLSPETIYIAQARLTQLGGKLAVEHLVRIPVPVPEEKSQAGLPTSTLNTSFLTDNRKLGTLIQQSMSQFRWNSKHVMVTLSHHLGLLRYFTMPAIERQFWKSAVPVEAKKYIPIPFEALSYDYQCLPLPPDAGSRSRQGALIAVTQKQNLANITAMLQSLGLTIAGMEVAPCSALQLWQALDQEARKGSYCQVHFDGGNVRILLSDKGLPVFFREVFLGEEANLADQRKLDLAGCITFAQKQLAVGAASRIVISGSIPNLPAWRDAFSRELGLPVNIQETAQQLGIKSGDWGGYAAIGAALRFQAPHAVSLDLGAVDRTSDEEKKIARDILIAGGALAAFIFVLGLFNLGLYQIRARDFKSLKRDPFIEDVFRGKSPNDIENMFKKMRQQGDMTMAVCSPARIKMTDIFKVFVDSLPEKAWLTDIKVARILGGAQQVDMKGHAVAENPSAEQELSFQFRDRLNNAPMLQKLFGQLQSNVNLEETTQAPGGMPLSPEKLAQKMEGRTTFSVTGTRKGM